MKKSIYSVLLLSIMSLAVPPSATASVLIPGPKSPRSGDRLTVENLKDFVLEISEGSFLLDLSDADISAPYSFCYLGVSDKRFSGESPYSRIYIEEAGDTLLHSGYENGMASVLFSAPVIWYWEGIQVGDSITGSYRGSGSFCSRLHLDQEGVFVTKMPAEGLVVLPSGDSLRHVQMVVTTRSIFTECSPIDTLCMHESDVMQRLSAMTGKDCRFYAPGYRYPIVELSELSVGGTDKPRHRSAIFCSPSSQEELAYDEENETIRGMLFQSRYGASGSVSEGSEQDAESRPYRVLQDDTAHRLTVTYDLPEAATVSALLCNSRGMVYQSVTQHHDAGIGYTLTLSYAGLHHGQYAVRLSIGEETFMEMFNVK